MSRYHHNKTTHELEPIAGYGSRVATSVDGKTLTVHSSLLNIDGYNYGSGDIGAAVQMIATIESGMAATKDYISGECFVYNAILYVVTEDVEDGDEFVIGENCELAPNLSEQILATRARTEAVKASIDNQLTIDNTKFYFDSHDGKYGYNTSANRGADTFVPFSTGCKAMFSSTYTNLNNNPTYTWIFLCREDPTQSKLSMGTNWASGNQSFDNDYLTATRNSGTHTLSLTFKKDCERWDMMGGSTAPASTPILYSAGDTLTMNNVYSNSPVFLF